MRWWRTGAVAAVALAAGAATAGAGPLRLDAADRAILHDELVGVLAELPELLAGVAAALPDASPASRGPDAAAIYAEHAAADRAGLAEQGAVLFDPGRPGFGAPDAAVTVALFIAADCPDCARAEAELRALARTRDLRVTLFDIGADAALARALGLDIAPSYVFEDRMLRGHMPVIVLEKYLDE
ncbi:MAG: thioredoxin family protein [Roseovarius sp.]|nr:thioredoxin family protein [Roseovarius sp.]